MKFLANIFDHAIKGKKYKHSFRMFTKGWTGGVTFIPLAYRHMISENKRNRYNEANTDVKGRSCGGRARKQAIQK